jgi:hypothetical protein
MERQALHVDPNTKIVPARNAYVQRHAATARIPSIGEHNNVVQRAGRRVLDTKKMASPRLVIC